MIKKLKFLPLILAIALSAMTLSSCGEARKKEAVRKTTESFLDAVCSLKTDEAMTYVDPSSDYYAEGSASFGELSDFLNNMDLSESFGEYGELYEDETADFVDRIVALITDNMSYTINDIKVSASSATVSVTLTMPDVEDIDTTAIGGMFSGENALHELGFSEEDFFAYLMDQTDNSDLMAVLSLPEDELYSYIASYMKDKGIIANIFDGIYSSFSQQLSTSDSNTGYLLELKDGKWLIVGENQ